MRTKIFVIAIFLTFALLIVGCNKVDYSNFPVSYWVLGGRNWGHGYRNNSLAAYDIDGNSLSTSKLPAISFEDMLISDNQVWLGEGQSDWEVGNKLLLWQEGEIIDQVEVGEWVRTIANFSDQIVVGCRERGFYFSIWTVDPETRESHQVAVESHDDKTYGLRALSANDDYVIAAANHSDPDGIKRRGGNTTIWWYDQHFNSAGSLYLGPGSSVWSILPWQGDKFLLLNNGAFLDDDVDDILIFDPAQGEIVGGFQGQGFPMRGVIADGKVYILNRIWSSIFVDERRSVTIIDGDDIRTVPLPDDLGAVDIAAQDGEVFLAVWNTNSRRDNGVYRVDTNTGEVELKIRHNDASRVILVDD